MNRNIHIYSYIPPPPTYTIYTQNNRKKESNFN